MSLKEKIQTDFIQAMKSKDEIGKRALSSLKSKITEAEKLNKNVELDDNGVIKVITSVVKQRRQSIDEYTKYGRLDLAEKEKEELSVYENYLPKQLTVEEIISFASNFIKTNFSEITNKNMVIGKTIGEINKTFPGRTNTNEVSKIINELIK
jgi:uncharacterized protein YqeY